jgi:hypothetical protein
VECGAYSLSCRLCQCHLKGSSGDEEEESKGPWIHMTSSISRAPRSPELGRGTDEDPTLERHRTVELLTETVGCFVHPKRFGQAHAVGAGTSLAPRQHAAKPERRVCRG